MNPDTTTPRTDACPHCGAGSKFKHPRMGNHPYHEYKCGYKTDCVSTTELCHEREARQKAEAEVERLKANLRRAIEIAKCGLVGPASDDLQAELDQIKVTL